MLIRSFAAAARLVFAVFAIFAFSATAAAQFLTFVSATGNDANTCFVQASPCKTLQRAINQTSAGGEVRVISQLTSNGVINKSITIDGGGNTVIGTIVVNSASAIVAFRELNLTGRNAFATGFNIINAAVVHIEDCTVERYTGDGIKLVASTATKLFVFNTAARDNTSSGLYVFAANARVTVENSRFDNNTSFGLYLLAARATVTRSSASGNSTGMALQGGPEDVTESTAADNAIYGFYFAGGAVATVDSSVARGENYGLFIDDGALVVITNTVIRSKSTAIHNQGLLATRGNNTVLGGASGAAAEPFDAF